MFSQETLRTAHSWYHLGIGWIERGALSQGLAHLDKALTVFEENGNTQMKTLTQHQKLFGCMLGKRYEEAENLFAETMQGYTALEDHYGEALLSAHFGEILAKQGRWPLAMSWWNVGKDIAKTHALYALQAYLQMQQASVMQRRETPLQAVRLLEESQVLLQDIDDVPLQRLCIHTLAQAHRQLGETSKAIALLEDLHTRMLRARLFHDALEPLKLLALYYEEVGMDEERSHAIKKLHFAAQTMLRNNPQRITPRYLGPEIGINYHSDNLV